MNNFLDKRIGEVINQLEKYITPVRVPINGWQTMECGYKKGNKVPSLGEGEWREFGNRPSAKTTDSAMLVIVFMHMRDLPMLNSVLPENYIY